jgi:RNA polymerase sigma-70 factor, ECF subfamily
MKESGMFYSLAIPGILPAWPGRKTLGIDQAQARAREKAHASMTEDEAAGDQNTEASLPLQDDASALSMLYEQFRRPIHSYVYRLLGNVEDADDVTQEVFIRACISWERLYARGSLSAWLYRIATNLCVDVLRRRKRISWRSLNYQNGRDDHFEGSSSDDNSYLLPDSGGIPEIAEREHIRLALAKMPEEYATVLVLSAAQGIPYQQIAAIIGISPNAAATRISRAKRMFVEQYQRISKDVPGKQENKP